MSDISSILVRLGYNIDSEGGRVSFMAENNTAVREEHAQPMERWIVSVEYGEEEPGSPIYGGAAYGTGATIQEALAQVVQDMGL